MTRADINIVLPSGKVMHWYKNGDQYPDGVARWFGMDILLHDLACAYRWNEQEGATTPEAEIEKRIEAWYNFAYTGLYKYAGGVTQIYNRTFPVIEGHTDWGYIIDLKNKKFEVYSWGELKFSVSQSDLGEPEDHGPMQSSNSFLYKAFEWLKESLETADNRVYVRVETKQLVEA